MKENKTNLVAQVCVLSDANKRLQAEKSFNIWVRNYIYLFLKNYISHNCLYMCMYEQLSLLVPSKFFNFMLPTILSNYQ